MSGMSLCPAFRHRLRSFWHQFFGTIALMEFVLKNPCQQLCSFSLVPCQRSYACPIAQCLQTTWQVLGPHFFWTITLMEFVLKTRANSSPSQRVTSSQRSSPKLFPTVSRPSTASMVPSRSFPTELSPSYFPRLPLRPPCRFRSCSFPTELAPSYFPRFPLRPPCRRFMSLPSCSLPTELSPNYFPQFPSVHPVVAPQAISHGFPSVHRVVASVLLPPNGALPKLFPTVSPPSTLSSLPSRSFPTKLSPSYFPRFPVRPPFRCFHPAPSNGALPKLFPTASPPSTLLSLPFLLLPNGARPKLFPTVSPPSTVSSLHVASVLLPPNGALPKLCPTVSLRPPCRRFHLAPSRRSSPQTISHGFRPPSRRCFRIAPLAAK